MYGSRAIRGVLALIAASVVALATSTAAPASETIGQTFTTQACGSNQALVQRSTSGPPGYQATTSGVIVSWRYQTVASPPSIRLRVYRAGANPSTWFARSESSTKVPGGGAGQVKANTLNTFSEGPGLRIEAGDVLGLTASGGNGISCGETASNADEICVSNGPPAVGASNSSFVCGALLKLRLGVSATIEADADGDGFGDESQDGCPTESSTQGACPDADGDGFSNSVDPCPNDSDVPAPRNPRTGCPADTDGDGTADPADPDDDNDGVPDTQDAFPGDPAKRFPDSTVGPDTITGTSLNDVMCGLAGNDKLDGAGGNDTLWGDACDDRAKPIVGAQASTDGNDTLTGGEGNDKLFGAGGKDKLKGGNGKDKLAGGDGNDSLDGGAGKDALDGGRGNDKLVGGKDTNSYKGGAGNDAVSARNGKKETVDCGSGSKDSATVDRTDKVKSCETVRRPKK